MSDSIIAFHQRRMTSRLREAKEDPAAVALGEIIAACRPENRCYSGACYLCSADFQKYAVKLTERLIVRQASVQLRNRKSLLTIVPSIGCVIPEALSIQTYEVAQAETARALAACNFPPCVGGIDVSYNEDDTGKIEPHCSVHFHCVVLDWPSEDQKKALKREVPPTALVKRPVHLAQLDNDERGVAYAWKVQKVRRVTYLDRSNPDRKPFRNTHIRELRPEHVLMLAKVEHEFGLMRRLLIHGIDADAIERASKGFD